MEKSYTISKMVHFQHTWIIEPAVFQPHCPRHETVTGSVKWELNACVSGWYDQAGRGASCCADCGGPYIMLLSERPRDAMIEIREGGFDRKVFLPWAQYSLKPGEKFRLLVQQDPPRGTARLMRRKIVCKFYVYEHISVDPKSVVEVTV